MFILPHGVFFRPNEKFLNLLGSPRFKDVAILEAGAGTGFTLKKVKEFGKKYGVSSMANSRGFDIHYRDKYDCSQGEVFLQDANECTFYHQNLQVLVCRPDHGGWVGDLLDDFLLGDKVCKRFIYVGLESNLKVDFMQDQLNKVSEVHTGVGEDEEVMYVWEIV